MKHQHKLALVALISLLIAASVFGSETRINTLGYLANFHVRDTENIWLFPSSLTEYRKMIIAESSYGDELWRGGVHIPLSTTFTMGVYLENTNEEISYADTQMGPNPVNLTPGYWISRSTLNSNLPVHAAAHQYTVFGAFELSSMSLGFYASSHSSKLTSKYTDPADTLIKNYEDNLSYREYGIGISMNLNERNRFDGTIFLSSGSFKHLHSANTPPQTMQPEGYSTFGVAARLFHAVSSTTVLVPFASYASGGEGYRSLIDANIPTTSVNKFSQMIVGGSANIIPFENNLITLSAGLMRSTMTREDTWPADAGTPPVYGTNTGMTLPFLSIGMESQLTKWLGARLAFYELLQTDTEELNSGVNNAMNEVKLTGNSYSAVFGLWFKLGKFTIDTLIDTDGAADFLHNGPFLFSGNMAALFSKLSIIYNFE
ncbi:hypothetical protein BVY01_02690 [bacterium I07]|nr:hypothetical protein BVY01_02690 [bacterium I07]